MVDRLTKIAHFLPIKNTTSLERLVKLYSKEIVRLHGIPASIVLDRDLCFTSRFVKEGVIEDYEHTVEFQHNISTANQRPVRENYSDPRRHVEGVRFGLQRHLGPESFANRVCLQQQLSWEHWDAAFRGTLRQELQIAIMLVRSWRETLVRAA